MKVTESAGRAGWVGALVLIASATLVSACSDRDSSRSSMSEIFSDAMGRGSSESRAETLGPWLDGHWQLPVPPQGPAPDWSPLEESLRPGDCGTCHPEQFAQWKGSLHAAAFSPGLSGQFVEGDFAAPEQVAKCQGCHAPLTEQLESTPEGHPNPHFDRVLREQGIACASCHVRSNRRLGPPRRAETTALGEPTAHGGFEARVEFQDARFCAVCHQFFDDPGINGKPVQNTYAEWRESPFAEEGQTCQSCHMPDRAHLWKGIHDPDMVRGGVAMSFERSSEDALGWRLTIQSHGVGHAFPTYVTPRVYVSIWQVDASEDPIDGTREEHVIGREVDFATKAELFDTRIPAGESAHFEYQIGRAGNAKAIRARIEVRPDHFYEGVYEQLLEMYREESSRGLIAEALQRATASRYVLWETRKELD